MTGLIRPRHRVQTRVLLDSIGRPVAVRRSESLEIAVPRRSDQAKSGVRILLIALTEVGLCNVEVPRHRRGWRRAVRLTSRLQERGAIGVVGKQPIDYVVNRIGEVEP